MPRRCLLSLSFLQPDRMDRLVIQHHKFRHQYIHCLICLDVAVSPLRHISINFDPLSHRSPLSQSSPRLQVGEVFGDMSIQLFSDIPLCLGTSGSKFLYIVIISEIRALLTISWMTGKVKYASNNGLGTTWDLISGTEGLELRSRTQPASVLLNRKKEETSKLLDPGIQDTFLPEMSKRRRRNQTDEKKQNHISWDFRHSLQTAGGTQLLPLSSRM